ncbi:MAG: RNA methyltransferase [Pelatocladus maniniholoensis HA4357-MV3]|jgi:tRNA/rRNA methyltransferase|uniref:tRNA (cytidine/uridine-2'-O-)-methyltransferase TrmJ n=1 Tax=Pelatocladus maniniholoensis HA4357-MV3 TaxID=1117104 RepID=A0A9E3LWJ3_9NOST|nr:RNA methyltransferase [Pelatocladus maniniholoensis HA4357-MV3]BAZ69099.1 RNA methyltransferase [Fischerella sp. NIES-4106]
MTIAGVKIILVEPAGPLNVGSVARVMKNFGLNQMVLVNPQCDPWGTQARQMAVHAQDVLDAAVLVETLPAALQGCKRAIATTGVVHDWDAPLENPQTALPWLLEDIGQPAALIFGREDRGLSNQELNYAQRFVHIDTSSSYSSLNLATAVAICCYELSLSQDTVTPGHRNTGELSASTSHAPASLENAADSEIAPIEIVEGYYQQLESLLLKIGYLYPQTAASRMEKFRQLYNRTQLQKHEVAMLRGILRQVEWAISSHKNHEKL